MRLLKLTRTCHSVTRPCTVHQRLSSHSSASQIRSSRPLTILSEDETMLRESVAKFAAAAIAPKVKQMDDNEKLDAGVLKQLFENGLMGIETAREFGGAGLSFTCAILAVEELAKTDPSISVVCDVQNTLVNTIFHRYATKEQHKKYLARLATDTVGCFCLSEASSGSDAFALKTTARKDGDGYILEGSKMWITNSDEANVFLVFANVDPTLGYKGITCFIAERADGVQIAKKESKVRPSSLRPTFTVQLGIRASSTCTVSFDGVRLPEDRVVGQVGRGYKIAIEVLNEGRIGIAAQMIGLAQGVFDHTLPYLFQRKQFGQAIGDFQAMQHQYALVATEIEAARLLTYNASRLKEYGQPFAREAAMAKLYGSRVAERAASQCIEWLGGVGFTRDFPAEKYFRDCKIGAIYEGTSNIQLQTIAKMIASDYKIES